MGYFLGVDLGTTYTAAAIMRDGRPEMVVLGSRTAAVPTVVYISESGDVVVGEAAQRRVTSDPDRVARGFKRRLGDATPIFIGSSPRSAESLMAAVLRWVVERISEQEGGPPEGIVVTHPANWGPYRRELFEQAIRQSDVVATTTTEPEAAAVYYASTERVEPGELVAVYDLGGGTFDAALLRKGTAGFEVVGSPEGIEHLGGIDVDEAIFEHVRRALGATMAEVDAEDPATMRALYRLRDECAGAKEALSFDSTAAVPVLLPGVQSEVVITRPELEQMIRPIIADTIAALRRTFASAGATPEDARAVLLVGGSSRIPLISETITQELGRPVAVDAHPKHAVALGAVLTAAGVLDVPAGGALDDTTVEPGEAGPASPIAIPSEVPALTPAGTPDGGGPSRRPWILAGLGALAAIVVAVLLVGGGGGDGGGATTTQAPATTAEPNTTAATAVAIEVPTGPPLDTAELAFTRVEGTAWNVWLIEDESSSARRLTNENAVRAQLPVLSPDRRSVAYTVADGATWQLLVVASTGEGERVIVEDMAPDARATWSPDGSKIAFVSDRTGFKDIWVLDLETGEQENITQTDVEEGDPAWSPDGDRIAFWARVAQNQDIFVIPADGGQAIQLTTTEGDDGDPAWHPNGDSLAFASLRDGDWEIFVMDDTGQNQRPLTSDPAADQDPSFSPDGSQIAFESKRDNPTRDDFAELYVMQADGSAQRRITNNDGLDAHPAWGLAGQ